MGIILALAGVVPAMAAMSDYCSVPPFLASSQAMPNLMIMLDNSGSMADHPFIGVFNPTQYDSKHYFGYFEPTKMYKYNKTSNIWEIYTGVDPFTSYTDTTQPIASGDLLNWAVTRKLEVAKKLLVGGNPGYISAGTNSRTVIGPNTVKLYTEDQGSSNNVTFDNSTANPLVTLPSYTFYLVPGYSDVIYPFNGKFTYKLASGGCGNGTSTGPACSKLSLTPVNTGTSTANLYPNGDISVSANWIRMNNLTVSATGLYNTYVDETAQDSDATTIANRVDTNPIILDYAASTVDLSGLNIQDVNVVVTARMVDGTNKACTTTTVTGGCYLTNSNNTCNGGGCAFSSNGKQCLNTQCKISGTNFVTCGNNGGSGANCSWQIIAGINQCAPAGTTAIATRAIQGVLSIGTGPGTKYASASANLNNTSSTYAQYDTYTFTWSVNPATNAAWTSNDIKSGASTTTLLAGIGVQNNGAVYNGSTQACYVNITQVYLYVDATEPSGGPYSLVVDTGKQTITDVGILDTLAGGARFGLGTYGPSSNGAKVLVPIDFSNTSSIAEQIVRITPGSNTPLAESEYELLNYFRQVTPAFASTANAYSIGSKTVNDPYYYMYSHLTSYGTSTLNDQYVPCAKSYILLMTDGEPTADDWQNASGDNVSKPTGFTTDRFETGSFLDDIALWGRTTDMRPGACSGPQSSWTFPCIPSPPNQIVVTYPIYLFGSGSQLLQSTAINGGFSGAVPANGIPPCLDLVSGITASNYIKPGATQAELKLCFRFDSNNASGTINPIAPWGTGQDPPITYYEGSDAYQLQSSLTAAISDIMKKSASGTSVSVLTTSSRGVGSMLQAYFLPIYQEGLRQVTWTGYVQNLWLYDDLREDSVPDKQLIMSDDNVIKMYLDPMTSETMAAKFTTNDIGTGGTLSTCSPLSYSNFSDINYLWEGGQKLALTDPSARTIYTAKKVIRGTTTTNTFAATNNFSVSSLTTEPTFSTALNADAVYSAENIVRYVRGECLESKDGSGNPTTGDTSCTKTANPTYRDRRITVLNNSNQNIGDAYGNVWKLGDIITSTPQVLGTKPINAYFDQYFDQTYFDFTEKDAYKKRSSIAFVGANDGMLHAFRVGYLKPRDQGMLDSTPPIWALFENFENDSKTDRLGEEVWSYIPFNAFPYLKYLANPDYCHIYFNDLPINLADVSLGGSANPNPTDAKTADSWRTIIVGSMRFGGCGGAAPQYPPAGAASTVGYSAYYAIDVTKAESPVPLWEFTDADMGYATSYPAIIRTGDNSTDKMSQNGYWYVVFGSGSVQLPGATSDIARTTTGYVYVLDLKSGALVKKIALDHNAIVGDILAIDANNDYLSEKVYLGTSYGNIASGWKGKLVSIDIPNQDLSGTWTPKVNYIFSGNAPFTAKPDATLDNNSLTWVFDGTGKYFTALDQADTSQQIFLGIKDVGISSPLTIADLDNRTNTTTSGAVTNTKQACMYDPTINGATNLPYGFGFQTVVTAISTSISTPISQKGWYLNLATSPSAERVISRPTVFGSLVDFLTYIPNGDPCNAGGNSYLYSVGYASGTAPSAVSIYSPKATSATSGNVTVNKGILMGPGTPPTGESIILAPKTSNENTFGKKVQVSTGVIVELTDNPPTDTTSKILHWLRK